jgi:hypothetical protein
MITQCGFFMKRRANADVSESATHTQTEKKNSYDSRSDEIVEQRLTNQEQ